jgi:uncharacterized protein YndB with AHSA1/START domain
VRELMVKKAVTLNTDASKVWEALVNPKMTKQYMFGCEVVSDWKVGSPILWKGVSEGTEKIFLKGLIIKIEQGKLLQFTTMDPNADYPDEPDKRILATYKLVPGKGRTLLLVTQGDYSKVRDGEKRYNETDGSWDYALGGLKVLLEGDMY